MKRIHWLIIGIFICALVGVFITSNNGITAQEEATPTPNYSYINVEAARVRAAPSETSLSIGTLLRNARVIPYNRDESGNWVLVDYANSFGWIRRDLALWIEDIDSLPILADNLTPTPAPRTPSATPRLVTLTPVGSYVIARVNVYVRTGPGLSFTPLGILRPGDVVEPVNIDETGTWVLIRFSFNQRNTEDDTAPTQVIDGFGWVARNVVLWTVDVFELPILFDDALTPTLTFTPSYTPSATPSATTTETATVTPTSTATNTSAPTITPSLTATNTDIPTETPSPTMTNTDIPTETPSPTATNTETPTNTDIPSEITVEMPLATNTDIPTETPTSTVTATNTDIPTETPTNTDVPTETPSPTATNTDTPSETPSPTMTNTDLPSETPTATATEATSEVTVELPLVVNTETPIGTALLSPTPTNTDMPSETPTLSGQATAIDESVSATATIPPDIVGAEVRTQLALEMTRQILTFTPEATEETTPESVVAQNPTETPIAPTVITSPDAPETSIPAEAILAGIALFIIVGYVLLVWRGQSAVDRYTKGFIIEKCPVCRVGNLEVETRTVRILGIPRPRRTIRCDNCRSLLRETGAKRWRYAVDKLANIAMYDRYNGLEVDERALQKLAQNPIQED